MEAPLVFPDIDQRIASLAVAVLCALMLAYLAYTLACRAQRRAELADQLAGYAAEDARIARLEIAAVRQALPQKRLRRGK